MLGQKNPKKLISMFVSNDASNAEKKRKPEEEEKLDNLNSKKMQKVEVKIEPEEEKIFNTDDYVFGKQHQKIESQNSNKHVLDFFEKNDNKKIKIDVKKENQKNETKISKYRFSNEDLESDSDSEKKIIKVNDSKKIKSKEIETTKNISSLQKTLQNSLILPEVIQEVDILNQNVLNTELAKQINKMYGNFNFDEDGRKNLELFQRDLIKECVIDEVQIGDPITYQTIKSMINYSNSGQVNPGVMKKEMIDLCKISVGEFDDDELQLSTPDENERPCINDKNCQAYKWFSVILMEYIKADEKADYFNGKRNEKAGPCLMCIRNAAESLQCIYITSNKYPSSDYVFQPIRNIVNEVGQYHFSDCLQVGYGILFPIVENKLEKYTKKAPTVAGGKTYIKQTGYKKFTEEDLKNLNF
jgi:hypothetical protein